MLSEMESKKAKLTEAENKMVGNIGYRDVQRILNFIQTFF